MDQRVLSPPHGLSQSATSFIASYRQGIHQTPLSRLIRSSECMTQLFGKAKQTDGQTRCNLERQLFARRTNSDSPHLIQPKSIPARRTRQLEHATSTDPHHMFPMGLAKAFAHRLRDMLSPAFRSRQYRQRVWRSQTQWSVY